MGRELLFSITKKDFEIQTFRCGGHGGQNVNKVETGVRIINKESGAVGESRQERSQYQNKRTAFKRLAESQKFKEWHNRKIYEVLANITIEQAVDKMMASENIKVEIKDDTGKWIDWDIKKDNTPESNLCKIQHKKKPLSRRDGSIV